MTKRLRKKRVKQELTKFFDGKKDTRRVVSMMTNMVIRGELIIKLKPD